MISRNQSRVSQQRHVSLGVLLLAALICETSGFGMLGVISSFSIFLAITIVSLAFTYRRRFLIDATLCVVIVNSLFCICVLVQSLFAITAVRLKVEQNQLVGRLL